MVALQVLVTLTKALMTDGLPAHLHNTQLEAVRRLFNNHSDKGSHH